MSVYPVVLLLTLLAIAIALLRPRWSFAAAASLLPLGMGAALVLTAVGNLTVLASTAAFAGLTVMTLIRPALGTGAPVMPRVEARTMLMLLIAVWGVVSAFIMPRLFAQEIDVISYARSASGVRVSHQFSTTLTPLVPSSGNLSQPAYLFLSALLLYAAVFFGRRYGVGALESGIYTAGIVNALLGALDLVGLEAVFAPLQTASYALLSHHEISEIPRVIGGFPEASAFGSFSAVLFAYFASRFLDLGQPRDGLLAAANGGLGLFALSLTGFLAFAAAGGVIAVRSVNDFAGRGTQARVLAVALVAVLGGLAIVLSPGNGLVMEIVDRLILSKAETTSGLERGFWALHGLRVGLESFGLGVGLGSTRANGWASVWFGNLGAIGLGLLIVFLLSVLASPGAARLDPVPRVRFRAAFAALLADLVSKLASATVADPGPLFMLLAAILITVTSPSAETCFRDADSPMLPRTALRRPVRSVTRSRARSGQAPTRRLQATFTEKESRV